MTNGSDTSKPAHLFPEIHFSQRIDFASAALFQAANGSIFLVFSGQTPLLKMEVSARPQMEEHDTVYWQHHVIGIARPPIVHVDVPYVVTQDVTDTCGTMGIELIGAFTRQKLTLAKGSEVSGPAVIKIELISP